MLVKLLDANTIQYESLDGKVIQTFCAPNELPPFPAPNVDPFNKAPGDAALTAVPTRRLESRIRLCWSSCLMPTRSSTNHSTEKSSRPFARPTNCLHFLHRTLIPSTKRPGMRRFPQSRRRKKTPRLRGRSKALAQWPRTLIKWSRKPDDSKQDRWRKFHLSDVKERDFKQIGRAS